MKDVVIAYLSVEMRKKRRFIVFFLFVQRYVFINKWFSMLLIIYLYIFFQRFCNVIPYSLSKKIKNKLNEKHSMCFFDVKLEKKKFITKYSKTQIM
jgi:hypothetical protein